MRIFLAGATGAIGRPLVPLLLGAGHEVVGTTRSLAKAQALREIGVEPAVLDALDATALHDAIVAAKPEVVIHQLTDLPHKFDPRDKDFAAGTNVLRGQVGPALVGAAAEAGARRVVAQSIAFLYAPQGPMVVDEDAPVMKGPGPAASAMVLENAVLEHRELEGVVLRYGWFYGPNTYYARDGHIAGEVLKRRFPIVGSGSGVFSFCHVNDAAAATLLALDGAPGRYNIADNEPAPQREWLPVYAEALGAKRPLRVPFWIAKLAAGPAALQAVELRGVSNERARHRLGFDPAWRSWRDGFASSLD